MIGFGGCGQKQEAEDTGLLHKLGKRLCLLRTWEGNSVSLQESFKGEEKAGNNRRAELGEPALRQIKRTRGMRFRSTWCRRPPQPCWLQLWLGGALGRSPCPAAGAGGSRSRFSARLPAQ